MKTSLAWITTIVFFAATCAFAQTPIGTVITYEGQLKSGGSPANGNFNMSFQLFDAVTAGNQIGPTLNFDGAGGNPPPVTVTNGLFMVQLDFTVTPYTANQARWLEISVNGTTLSPRQALTAAPFALDTRGLNVDTSGNVGIGTSAPTSALEVHGPGSSTQGIHAGPIQAVQTTSGDPGGDADGGALVGISQVVNGQGIIGIADLDDGPVGAGRPVGVWGMSAGVDGYGVYGMATHTSGRNYGVRGTSASANGYGGYFEATGLTGTNYGVRGTSSSTTNGFGGVFEATASTGANFGVLGSTASPNGYGGYFVGRGYFSGNVGIGTTTPAAKLHVTANGEGLRIQGTAAGASSSAWVGFNDSTGAAMGYVGDGSGGNSSMYLSSYFGDVILGTPAGAALTAKDNGNVGIGTDTPAMKLTVAGDMEMGTSSGDYRHFRVGGGNSSGFIYGSYPHFGDGIHIGYNYYADSNGSNIVTNPGGGTSRISMGYGSMSLATAPAGAAAPVDWVYLTSTGFVGIGTGLPGQRLHVIGNICASGSIGACSDARYKTNIEPLGDALSLIAKLRPVLFDWRRDEFPDNKFSAERQVGLIAQEVRSIVPEVVQEGNDGYLSVDYGRLTPILVEAVKQMKCEKDTQVADQQRAIGELRTENAELKARLERLEAMISKAQTKEDVR